MAYLMLVSLGPVQEFITSARRFRDLWFGSWMLAQVAGATARAMQAQGASLIFPAPQALEGGDDQAKVANKILAEVPGAPAQVAAAAREAAQNALMQIAHEAFARFKHVEAFDLPMAEAQIRNLLEFQWVAVERGADYRADRARAESLLAARKNTREFTPPEWALPGRPKSSLDGLREAVIDPGKLTAKLRRQLGLKASENLCGVGLLKRQGGGTKAVPSTSHMAALGSLFAVASGDRGRVRAAAEALQADLGALGIERHELERRVAHPVLGTLNGQVLYENRLHELLVDDADALQAAQRLVSTFKRETRGCGVTVHPYYALLQADGDRMGEAIDGMTTPEQHRDFSARLETFATEAERIVAAHDGFLVYAGGDDVLALLPLHQALGCARKLADDFKRRLAEFNRGGNPLTLSVGIAIGHQLDPAADTRERARRAEMAAKSPEVGRNALGLVIKKRGGSEQVLAGPWDTLDRSLNVWIQLHQNDSLPDGAAYELRQLARELGQDGPPAAYQAETARILKRKRTGDGTAVAAGVQEAIVQRATSPQALHHLAEELVAARLFADPGDR